MNVVIALAAAYAVIWFTASIVTMRVRAATVPTCNRVDGGDRYTNRHGCMVCHHPSCWRIPGEVTRDVAVDSMLWALAWPLLAVPLLAVWVARRSGPSRIDLARIAELEAENGLPPLPREDHHP